MTTTLQKAFINFQHYGKYEFAVVDSFKDGGKILSLGSGYIFDFLKLTNNYDKDITVLPSYNYFHFSLDYPERSIYSISAYLSDDTFEDSDSSQMICGEKGSTYKKIVWAISKDTQKIGTLYLNQNYTDKEISLNQTLDSEKKEAGYVKYFNFWFIPGDHPEAAQYIFPFNFLESDIQIVTSDPDPKPDPPTPGPDPKPDPPDPEPQPQPPEKQQYYSIKNTTAISMANVLRQKIGTTVPITFPKGYIEILKNYKNFNGGLGIESSASGEIIPKEVNE